MYFQKLTRLPLQTTQSNVPPLPKGEGRGEGEGTVHPINGLLSFVVVGPAVLSGPQSKQLPIQATNSLSSRK
jgi:hypothetical protein